MEFYYVRGPYAGICLPYEQIMPSTETGPIDSFDERIQEPNCFYRVFEMLVKGDSSLDNSLQKVVDLVPSALQFSEIASATINTEGNSEKCLQCFKVPFTKEEFFLLKAIANIIEQAIQRKIIEEEKIKL